MRQTRRAGIRVVNVKEGAIHLDVVGDGVEA